VNRVAAVLVVLATSCSDVEELEATSSADLQGGFQPPGGGVLDGALGTRALECSTCTGAIGCATACSEANGDSSTCGLAGPTCAAVRANIAAASALATAVASSTYSSATPAGALIDGNRRGPGGWQDASANLYPDWAEVRFYAGGSKRVSEVDVYTLQDACGSAPSSSTCVEPTAAMTFASWGATGYRVQAWDGSAFVDIPGATVTANDRVKRAFELSPPVTTSKVRVLVTGALAGYSRLIEVEAWEERSAFDPYLAQAINNRIAMTGATGCETTPHAITIAGVSGMYKHCNYAWVVASPGNGAWLLPESYVSSAYLGSNVWPATPTSTMTALGFPRGAYHGSDAADNYVVFERGILAKSNQHTVARRIGGLTAATGGPRFAAANAALATAWLEATAADKYPVTDTASWLCTSLFCTSGSLYGNYGFRFTTEANAGGYDATFLYKDGASAAFHVDGEIENTWRVGTPATLARLGWPVANETRIAANGSALSQFTGGAIVWKPTSCNSATFAAQIYTSTDGQPTPMYGDALVGMTCDEVAQVCQDGPEISFSAQGTYQFLCSEESVSGWWNQLKLRWQSASGPVTRYVRAPILRRYLSADPSVYGSAPISVEAAISGDYGLPLGNAFASTTETRQEFEHGTIVDARPCSIACKATSPCDLACNVGTERSTCGDFKPADFPNGMCQLYDIYCELPEITDARVWDNHEGFGNGPVGFFYYRKPGGGPEKRGVMPVQIGGVGGVAASNYLARWTQDRPDLADRPEDFPYASNAPGPVPVNGMPIIFEGPLQYEFSATLLAPETMLAHPVLPALQCVTVAHEHYGVRPPIPTFPVSSLHHVYEDDECADLVVGEVCNSDDYVASIRLYHGDCGPQHWSQGHDFGFTSPRTLTNSSPPDSPDLGGAGNSGSPTMDVLHYRTYCYRALDQQRSAARTIQTFERGIGTQQHSGFALP